MHAYLILMYLHRETYLSSITWLFICFILRGMECILVFVNLGGENTLPGREERKEVRAAQIAGWRRRQIQGEALEPSVFSFLLL